MANVSYLGRYV